MAFMDFIAGARVAGVAAFLPFMAGGSLPNAAAKSSAAFLSAFTAFIAFMEGMPMNENRGGVSKKLISPLEA